MQLLKALSEINRLRIVNLLRDEDLCVCEIEVILKLNQSNTSRHLSVLRGLNILSIRKVGTFNHYSLSETFKREHGLLLEYLCRYFVEQPFLEDKARFEKYKEKGFSCCEIYDDKDIVLKAIELCDC